MQVRILPAEPRFAFPSARLTHWQLFCLLPIDRVEPTPYQRDLSPAHAKRLQEVIRKLDRFVDPIVVVSPRPGLYWTPNGSRRLAALSAESGILT